MDNGFWKNRKCLVTGGMGFGGSHLAEQLLNRGAQVYILDRIRPWDSYLVLTGLVNQVEYIPGDVRDLELLKLILYRYEINNVFHLAAQPIVPMSIVLPYETLSINVMGTYAVLEAVRTSVFSPALVFASTGKYYGTGTTQHTPIPETQPPDTSKDIYGPSKIAGDFVVRSYAQTYGIKAAVCRFINTYGPGNTNFSTIVPRAISLLMEGQPYDFGSRDDGSSIADYLHVDDMARGYMAMAENIDHIRGEAFNFSGGQGISVRELTKLISHIFDGQMREPVFHGPPREVPFCKLLDHSRAEKLLGWHTSYSLVTGLEETVNWYRQYWPKLMKKSGENTRVLESAGKI